MGHSNSEESELEAMVRNITNARAAVLESRTVQACRAIRNEIASDMVKLSYPQEIIDAVKLAVTTAYEDIYFKTYIKKIQPEVVCCMINKFQREIILH